MKTSLNENKCKSQLSAEEKFLEVAIYIHEHCDSQEEFMENKELWNLMGTCCYDFFNIAFNYNKLSKWILMSPLDREDILNECAMHYMTKFFRLWENSTNEYYMKSVMLQLKNKVKDIAVRPFIQNYPSKEDINDFVEEILMCDQKFRNRLAKEFLTSVEKFGNLKNNAELPSEEDMVYIIMNQEGKHMAIKEVNNLIEKCVKRTVDKNNVPVEEVKDYLKSNVNVEESAISHLKAVEILNLSEKCTKFEIVSFYGTKVLGIKNCDISNSIDKFGFKYISAAILKEVAKVFEVDHDSVFNHFVSEKCVEYAGVEDLSDKISKKSLYCQGKLAKLAGVARESKTRCKVKK